MRDIDRRELFAREMLQRFIDAGQPTRPMTNRIARKLLGSGRIGEVNVEGAVKAIMEVLELQELRNIVNRYDDKMRQIDDHACAALNAVKAESPDMYAVEASLLNILTLSV